MTILLSGSTVVQIDHGLVDGLNHASNSGCGCHVDGVEVIIGANEDDVGVGRVGNASMHVQVGLYLHTHRNIGTTYSMASNNSQALNA